MSQLQKVSQALRFHSIAGLSAGTHAACQCERRWIPLDEFTAHQIEAVLDEQ